jgi:hypothetical protein
LGKLAGVGGVALRVAFRVCAAVTLVAGCGTTPPRDGASLATKDLATPSFALAVQLRPDVSSSESEVAHALLLGVRGSRVLAVLDLHPWKPEEAVVLANEPSDPGPVYRAVYLRATASVESALFRGAEAPPIQKWEAPIEASEAAQLRAVWWCSLGRAHEPGPPDSVAHSVNGPRRIRAELDPVEHVFVAQGEHDTARTSIARAPAEGSDAALLLELANLMRLVAIAEPSVRPAMSHALNFRSRQALAELHCR